MFDLAEKCSQEDVDQRYHCSLQAVCVKCWQQTPVVLGFRFALWTHNLSHVVQFRGHDVQLLLCLTRSDEADHMQ